MTSQRKTGAKDPARAQRLKNAIEAALRDGFDPFRDPRGGKGSSVAEAARRLSETGHHTTERMVRAFLKTQALAEARGDEHFLPDWDLFAMPGAPAAAIRRGEVRRWLLTSAQDDTDVHLRFWSNLQAYARHIGAEIVVGGFTYNHALYTDHETRTAQFAREVLPHLRFDPMDCGPVLFCAEMNTLPTAVRPLSGLTTYAQGRTAVFPHAKLAFESVPAMPGKFVPSVMTTGACTVPNYVKKKAGLKAEFHHVLGATVVEADDTGAAWCRQISATADGAFQDLDTIVRAGRISSGNRVKAVTFGDIHIPSLAADVFDALWGRHGGSLIEVLRPEYQFIHDLMSFEMASRHVDGDPIHRARMSAAGHSGIRWQVREGAKFLRAIERETCRTVMIESNHDDRLMQWARRDADRMDTGNAEYWHECNLTLLRAIRENVEGFNLCRWALKNEDARELEGIDFVPMGGSFVICQDSGGIECGMHGHQGPNGSRGTAVGLSKMGTRITIADKHSPQILDGVYIAGMSGDLDQGYNNSPSSWQRSHVITYANGKRTLITQTDDARWRA
jgi:hypothetical protein